MDVRGWLVQSGQGERQLWGEGVEAVGGPLELAFSAGFQSAARIVQSLMWHGQ